MFLHRSPRNLHFAKYFLTRCMSASTIFNLSSGFGKCGVAVIRVSGPQTKEAMRKLVSKDFIPKERYAFLKSFRHPVSKEVIDKGLVIWFPGPKSFTGEDSCEFQVHGGIAVVEAMLDALANVPGLRRSQPGEFTKRAFFQGKLDLTQVEGLADLIHAETETQRKQALIQSSGLLSKLYKSWRKRLLRCVAHMEAYIDFAEDENIESDLMENLKAELLEIRQDIEKHLNDQRQGEILRSGIRTVIVGAPNVGKSSLLNLMCQRHVSIVTPIAGTTRDIVESFYNICGYPVLFADTAGLRLETKDVVEKEGIDRAKEYIQNSDLVLLLMDASVLMEKGATSVDTFNEYKMKYVKDLGIDVDVFVERVSLVVVNKMDLVPQQQLDYLKELDVGVISCKDTNIESLLPKLGDKLKDICYQPTAENPRLTHSRYRQHLSECVGHITIFLEHLTRNEEDLAIGALKLRKAVKCIERITGHVSSDDILDVIFRDFCIGK